MASILVIDDEGSVREAIRLILEPRGHRIHAVAEGGTGVMYVASTPVDLVITDMLMPGHEGIETIRDLRRHSGDLPILAISGGGSTGFRDALDAARLFGANATLPKPFDMQALVAKVDALLGPSAGAA